MRPCATILLVLCLAPAPAPAAITAVFPTGADLVMHVDCPHPTPGFTDLDRLVWNSAETLAVFQYDTKLDNNLAGQFPGKWDYQLNARLTGTLTVEKYKAFDGPGACEHGAEISARLTITEGLAAGQQFAWLQVFHETGSSGSRSWKADPPKGLHGWDDLPFYYDMTEDYYDENAKAWTFSDRPCDPLADAIAHAGSVSFMLLLASWDGTYDAPPADNLVKVYGGLEWGYRYACVPEPGSLWVFLIGGVVVWLERRARRPSDGL